MVATASTAKWRHGGSLACRQLSRAPRESYRVITPVDSRKGALDPYAAPGVSSGQNNERFHTSMTQDATDQCRASPVLVLEHATKRFGAVCALEDGSITLYPGEAHALLGENGAGKSTLVKILAGVHGADSGQLLIDGEPVAFNGPTASRAAGISGIYQEPTLFPDLTVAAHIFMGRQPLRAGRRVDRASMNRLATELFARLGVQLDPDRIARGLSVADQQIAEIAKALSFNARVLVMDEPTAALTTVEVERLVEVIGALRSQGAALLFISHRPPAALGDAHRVTVTAPGRRGRTVPIRDGTSLSVLR